jgi:ABC-2 type transport system ATP-binding protein
MGDIMLEIKNLSKSYDGKNYACKDVSITINDGDIYGFIGPNGAGKSTTIKAICGIHSFEGEVLFDGKSITNDMIEFKRNIAYIPDNPVLYEHLTGIEYVNFILNIYDVKEDMRDEIKRLAKMFSIEDRLEEPIKGYSHGMKQKISIIAALAHKPKLLILDEPFVGLDPKATFELKEELKNLCSNGSMVFFSSHVLDVVEKFCNKIAIIKNGAIIESGDTQVVKGEGSLEEKFMEIFNE